MKKLKEYIIAELNRNKNHILDTCDVLTEEELLFIPAEGGQCIKVLLLHMTDLEEAWIVSVLLGQEHEIGERFKIDWETANANNLPIYDDLKKYFIETRQNFMETIEELAAYDFEDTLKAFQSEKKISVKEAISHMIESSSMYLGKIRMLIELQGKTPVELI